MASRNSTRILSLRGGVCWLTCCAIGLGLPHWPNCDQPKVVAVLAAAEPNADSPANVKILRSLNRPTYVEWHDLQLRDCLQYLREYHGMAIVTDEETLDAAKVSLDVRATLKLEGTSLRSVLRLLLDPLALDFLVDQGELVVTTRAQAVANLNDFSYEVGDVLQAGVSMAALIDAITQTIDRSAWQIHGGQGSMRGFQRTLHVRQRLDVQEHLQDLLRELMREVSEGSATNNDGRMETNEYRIGDLQEGGASNADILKWLCEFLLVEKSPDHIDERIATIKGDLLILKQPAWVHEAADEFFKVLGALNNKAADQPRRETFEMAGRMLPFESKRRITARRLAQSDTADFRDMPLEDALLYLQAAGNLNLYVDGVEIERAGIDLHSQFALKAENEPLQNLFDKVLEPRKLGWYVLEPDLIVVTSRTKAAARMEPRVYRTQRILAAGQTEQGLVKRLITSIEPDSWSAVGGPGTLHSLPGVLIVAHNRRVHEQTARLLASLEPGQTDPAK